MDMTRRREMRPWRRRARAATQSRDGIETNNKCHNTVVRAVLEINARAGERWSDYPMEASTSEAHFTGPADVIIGAPLYVATHEASVTRSGCNSSHVFFF